MAKLWELASAFKDVEKLFADGDIDKEDKVEMEKELLEMFKEKSESIIHYINNKKDEIGRYDDEIKRLNEHIKTIEALKMTKENELNSFKKYVVKNLLITGEKNIKTPSGMVYKKKTTKIVIDDFDKIDLDYKEREVKVNIKVDTKKIKKAFETGKRVEGARIETTIGLSVK